MINYDSCSKWTTFQLKLQIIHRLQSHIQYKNQHEIYENKKTNQSQILISILVHTTNSCDIVLQVSLKSM